GSNQTPKLLIRLLGGGRVEAPSRLLDIAKGLLFPKYITSVFSLLSFILLPAIHVATASRHGPNAVPRSGRAFEKETTSWVSSAYETNFTPNGSTIPAKG
ncbi:hypothetical protein NDU88_003560, partial [Pleurodeles waltl]